MVQIIQSKSQPTFSSSLAEGLSGGFSQGLGMAVQNMFDEKKKMRDLSRQIEINSKSASSLADNLRLKGSEKSSFVDMFSQLDPQKQLGALKNLYEAQMYQQFLGQQGEDEGEQIGSQNNFSNMQTEYPTSVQQPQLEQNQENVPQTQEQQNQGIQPVLPTPQKKYPPIGLTARAADIESRRYQKELDRNFKETADYRKSVEKQGESSKNSLQALSTLEELVNSGKLSNSLIASLAKKYEMIGLLSPESQLFDKTIGEFLPSMREAYPGQITNQHENVFLGTLPRLQQTDAGKKLLIKVLQKKEESKRIKYEIERDILKKTRGVPPLNLRDMVEEQSEKLLEQNYREILNLIASGARQEAPPGMFTMMDANGQLYHIPENDVEEAKKTGLKSL